MDTLRELQSYRFRGARALLLVHERALRDLVETWRRAKTQGVRLPQTTNPNYQSLETLLRHMLRTPQLNMTWICEKLGLPDPAIPEPPPSERVAAEADAYLTLLFAKLREPLVEVEAARMTSPAFESRWKQPYTIASMLQHLVAHVLTHRFQLEELLAAQSAGAIAEG